MKRITFFSVLIVISLAFVWGIVAFPSGDSDSERVKLADEHFAKAVDYINNLMFDKAIVELEHVINLVPNSKIAVDAKYWIGQSYYKAGNFDEALSTLEKLIEENPESAIIPVTQLMVGRVQLAKENEGLKRTTSDASIKGVIIDQNTGLKYTRTKTFVGKKDVEGDISPNGKFLFGGNMLVVPLDDGEPFYLVDMPASKGSLSPDGKKVVFQSGGGIWVISVSPETGRATSPAKKLLDGNYWTSPKASWSPDSELIVFERRDKGGRGDIWTISVKDGSLTQITDDPVWEGWPVWSPNGKTIAYERLRETWVIPAKGGRARKISSDRARVLSWSPDSEWIVLRLLGQSKIRFFRLDDDREFDMTNPPGEVGGHFAWSSNGKKMLFYKSSYDYKSSLKVVSTSGGPSFELGGQLKLWPYDQCWSPDNKMIVTEGPTRDGDRILWIIPLAGDEAFPLELDIPMTAGVEPSSLSPDCNKLLFSMETSDGTEELWVVPISLRDNRTTGPPVMVFSESGDGVWSPDGERLAVVYKGDIWIASAEGGESVQITKNSERKINLEWLPGNEMISYVAYHSQKEYPLMLISVAGDEPRKILDLPKGYTWSPNGKELAFVSEQFITVTSITGDETRRIADKKELGVDEANFGLCWSPDGSKLAFGSYNRVTGKPGPGPIFIVSVGGGEITRLATDDSGQKDYLYWSPDGKWISYNSDEMIKTRPGGTIWEADFEEVMAKLVELDRD
jgi:Tol biopolymer transport system component